MGIDANRTVEKHGFDFTAAMRVCLVVAGWEFEPPPLSVFKGCCALIASWPCSGSLNYEGSLALWSL